MEEDRRKKIIQEGKAPKKYIGMLVVSFATVLAVAELLFYWFARSIIKTMEFNLYNSYIKGLGVTMMIILFIFISIIGLINIIFTNRFFGPIKRLTRELGDMDKTGKYHPIEIRKNDELSGITTEINKMIEKVKK